MARLPSDQRIPTRFPAVMVMAMARGQVLAASWGEPASSPK